MVAYILHAYKWTSHKIYPGNVFRRPTMKPTTSQNKYPFIYLVYQILVDVSAICLQQQTTANPTVVLKSLI